MLTANYYGLLMFNEFNKVDSRSFNAESYEKSCKIRNLSNSPATSIGTDFYWGNYGFGSLGGADILIGTGNATPKRTDYCLQNAIATSNYAVVVAEPAIVYDGSTGQFYSERKFVISCTATSGITISEWGIKRNNYLILREVFETPYELALGETLTITVRATLNSPLAD